MQNAKFKMQNYRSRFGTANFAFCILNFAFSRRAGGAA
jgi:hypothetical protein